MVARHSWTRTAGAVDVITCDNCGNFEEEVALALQESQREPVFPYSEQLAQLGRGWLHDQFPDHSESELESIFPDSREIIRYYVLS